MPVTRIECCGESMTLQEALAHVELGKNRCHWTWELLSAVLASQTAHPSHEDPTRISTTVLTTKCLRQLVLERQTDFEVDPDNLWAMFRGTLFHKQLEQWAHWRNYAEARFYVHDMGVQIPAILDALPEADRSFSGSPDLVNPDVGILYDYKRTKEVPRYGRVWDDHAAQLNINRWLVDRSDTVELVEIGRGRLDAQVLEGAPGCTSVTVLDDDSLRATWDMRHPAVRARFVPVDWQQLIIVYADDKGPARLEATKSVQVPKKDGKGTKAARVANIWDDEQTEKYIADRYVKARLALLEGNAPIPAGWEYQSHVLCVRCPMKRACAENEREGR